MSVLYVPEVSVHLRAGTGIIASNTDEMLRIERSIKEAAAMTGDGNRVKLPADAYNDYNRLVSLHLPGEALTFEPISAQAWNLVYDSALLFKLFDAIYAKLAVAPSEELATQLQTVDILLNCFYHIVTWNLAAGFSKFTDKGKNDFGEALQLTRASTTGPFPHNTIFVMRDCHPFLNTESTPEYREILRNLVDYNQLTLHGESNHHIFFVQPDWTPHRDITSCITMLDYPLPDEAALDAEVTYLQTCIDNPEKRECPAELRIDLCRAMRGFTQAEASNAMAVCLAKHGGWHSDMLKTIHRMQQSTFSKGGVLTMADDDTIAAVSDVGGFDNYMAFIDECMLCYSPEAKKLKLSKPKGCLLLGIPGTGKSLVARVTAKIMKLPLLKYDFGAQFGSLIGQTEANQRQVIKQIQAKGPCVLLIDEADKVFSGTGSGYQGDSGVSMRAFGRLLSWMADENEEAFVILTMNRTLGIPPEMLRAGRLDAIYYTTFPTPRERFDILSIHMKKNGADLDLVEDWEKLISLTFRYVGAELEQLVKKAVRTAFKARKTLQPTLEELTAASKIITPVAKLDTENIEAIEKFCKSTATPVSSDKGDEGTPFKIRGRTICLGWKAGDAK